MISESVTNNGIILRAERGTAPILAATLIIVVTDAGAINGNTHHHPHEGSILVVIFAVLMTDNEWVGAIVPIGSDLHPPHAVRRHRSERLRWNFEFGHLDLQLLNRRALSRDNRDPRRTCTCGHNCGQEERCPRARHVQLASTRARFVAAGWQLQA